MLLALSDEGAPDYDHDNAAALAALGVPAFACTPDAFPRADGGGDRAARRAGGGRAGAALTPAEQPCVDPPSAQSAVWPRRVSTVLSGVALVVVWLAPVVQPRPPTRRPLPHAVQRGAPAGAVRRHLLDHVRRTPRPGVAPLLRSTAASTPGPAYPTPTRPPRGLPPPSAPQAAAASGEPSPTPTATRSLAQARPWIGCARQAPRGHDQRRGGRLARACGFAARRSADSQAVKSAWTGRTTAATLSAK